MTCERAAELERMLAGMVEVFQDVYMPHAGLADRLLEDVERFARAAWDPLTRARLERYVEARRLLGWMSRGFAV